MAKDSTNHPFTEALNTRVETEAYPSVTPLYQNSAFQAESPYFYTRKANPNSQEFEKVVCTLEGARHGISVTTGMTAISMVTSFLSAGDTVVLNKDIYGCTFKLFQRVAEKRGCQIKVLDLSQESEREQMPNDVSMVFFETPTNPFLKTVPIRPVVNAAKGKNSQALVVVDNTWATPLYQKPLQMGADISLHSATKYFSGHSDVMGGILLTDREDLSLELHAERFYTGSILAPHSAWLLRRSLQTLPIRMKEHQRVTLQMAEFLSSCNEVEKIYYPKVDDQQLTGYGGIIFFELRKDLKGKYETFRDTLQLFGTGTGMACVTSMVAQPFSGSHASMTNTEKEEMGISPELVRLCFGFEDPEDLMVDLKKAFAKVSGTL